MQRKRYKYIRFIGMLATVFFTLLTGEISHSQGSAWQKIDNGLEVGRFLSPQTSRIGSSQIYVIRINPEHYAFKLMCASEHAKTPLSVKAWCKQHGLISAINAGMFQADMLSAVSLMKNFAHINNPRLSKDNTIFAFNPTKKDLPKAQIIDRTVQNYDALKSVYQSQFQGIRMIAPGRKNVWQEQPDEWSIAALGSDGDGNILFIFSRSPYTVHDFINILLELPIDIQRAMYLDGGAVAQLYFSNKHIEIDESGVYESVLTTPVSSQTIAPIPNVIGIVKK
ncbi:conserved hypothetical protein [Chloroherpeton thalassium ATCC 35110]|uniref:Phosphodiester glycosidase domain-containing protein n=1 Tax=Chloroherpeton thalassium (strain ATCC 35110 / GB-78) TaxID=517418 RepID=B3QZA6_CHLT3|nr:phosphodiester glycosidase family protein [Chloroherpeton thalassium]ACF13799.1 conserved hypothetical protein [Chloroherpeton thalassium ATCC 35110]